MKPSILISAVLLAISGQALAINKCVGPDGKPVFQDAPCAGRGEAIVVKPSRGSSPAQPAAAAAAQQPAPGAQGAAPMSEAQRIESQIAQSQKERRKIELEARLVPEAYQAIGRHRAQCEAELRNLQNKKQLANNNLAGATWEGSISSEMTAIATRCDTRNRELNADYDRIRSECREMGGCR